MTKKNEEKLTFEQAFEKLESIVDQLDRGELKLDELESRFEEGMKMAAFCNERLEQVEQKVNLLIEKARGGGFDREPFEPEEV
jgi:exodeoxyribonuclease VII small subunit